MKKVGILTFIDTINYGASLQALASQEFLRQNGYEAEIVQYINEAIDKKEHNQKAFSLIKLVKAISIGRGIKNKTIKFRKFENENFQKGLILSENTKETASSYYDYFVVGSDQIWNVDITEYDWTYFLDFVKEDYKKISYAPSIGSCKFKNTEIDHLKQYVSKFRGLSVREQSGAEYLKENVGVDAEVVVDPTLLLSKEEWGAKTVFHSDLKEYILVYLPHNKAKVFEFVNKLKEKTNLPVVYLSISPRRQTGVKIIYDASPEEFLGWIKNAAYVVTGSFHGVAFSLNFEKQFFFESYDKGSRIDNITSLAEISERNILNLDALNTSIDYNRINTLLTPEREKSKKWLLAILEQ